MQNKKIKNTFVGIKNNNTSTCLNIDFVVFTKKKKKSKCIFIIRTTIAKLNKWKSCCFLPFYEIMTHAIRTKWTVQFTNILFGHVMKSFAEENIFEGSTNLRRNKKLDFLKKNA